MASFEGKLSKSVREDYVACAYLFSPEHAKSEGFIESLEIPALKKAFREKAKRYHPDLHTDESGEMIARRQERFVRIQNAYEHLFLKLRKKTAEKTRTEASPEKRPGPRIIAVGGAKGGIGKSIFTANLSVYLSGKGFKTIAADFDLGGSNLHLFLGRPAIRNTINDYLTGSVGDIREIMEPTRYGPGLIGGSSSRLGAANISFTRKLKLLKAIRSIEADYVIMDLGGDTSYNVLDFFLAADLGIVMTTCEPASYLDAYSFIKTALYRKLNRLHGPESIVSGRTDNVLKKLIYETTISKHDPLTGDIETLIRKIRTEHPDAMGIIKTALSEFTPQLIVNKVASEKESLGPVRRIQDVSRKKLSVNVEYLCSLPFQDEIEASARTLVPWISNEPDLELTQTIDRVAARLVKVRPRAN